MKKTAALYVRVNNSIEKAEKQLEELWAFAGTKGYKVIDAYYEIISGKTHVHERTFGHMLEDAKEHKFDVVIVKDITRISRSTSEFKAVTYTLNDLGIELVIQQMSEDK